MDDDEITISTGSASGASGDEQRGSADVAAMRWVPDPEARRGWRDYFVYRDKPNQKPGMGFRRNA